MPPPPIPDKNNPESAVTTGSSVDAPVNALDVEFEQLWEGCSDLDADDLELMKE